MRYLGLAAAALLGLTSMPVLAQTQSMDPMTGARPGHVPGVGNSEPESNRASNIDPSDTRSSIAPRLPSPQMGADASPADYLKAAYASLISGRTGEAQQSLEMAETRALGGWIPQGDTTAVPGDTHKVSEIRDARHALGQGDRAQAIALVKMAMGPSTSN